MLDKTSKKVLRFLRSFPDHTWHANQGYHNSALPFDEFLRAVEHLESQNYVTIQKVSGGVVSVSLSHRGTHKKEFSWIAFKLYVRENWIAFLALIVSIIALIRTL